MPGQILLRHFHQVGFTTTRMMEMVFGGQSCLPTLLSLTRWKAFGRLKLGWVNDE